MQLTMTKYLTFRIMLISFFTAFSTPLLAKENPFFEVRFKRLGFNHLGTMILPIAGGRELSLPTELYLRTGSGINLGLYYEPRSQGWERSMLNLDRDYLLMGFDSFSGRFRSQTVGPNIEYETGSLGVFNAYINSGLWFGSDNDDVTATYISKTGEDCSIRMKNRSRNKTLRGLIGIAVKFNENFNFRFGFGTENRRRSKDTTEFTASSLRCSETDRFDKLIESKKGNHFVIDADFGWRF